jgi:hypothetical protein
MLLHANTNADDDDGNDDDDDDDDSCAASRQNAPHMSASRANYHNMSTVDQRRAGIEHLQLHSSGRGAI